MHRKSLYAIATLTLSLVLASQACKPPEESAPKKQAGNDTSTGSATGSSSTGYTPPIATGSETSGGSSSAGSSTNTGGATATSTDCLNASRTSSTTGNGSSSGGTSIYGTGTSTQYGTGTGFGMELTDTQLAYNPDIKALIASRCLTCHDIGKSQPELDTYTKLKAHAIDAMSSVDSGRIAAHNDIATSANERLRLRNWIEGGAPEYSANGNGSTSGLPQPGTTGWVNPCDPVANATGGATGGEPTPTDLWAELVTPPLFIDCHNRGFLYDRTGARCHKAKIASSYPCTHQGVIDKFKTVGVNVMTNLAQLEAEGYVIDQCGEFGSDPVVFFYKKVQTNRDLSLLFKTFCKVSSPACSN